MRSTRRVLVTNDDGVHSPGLHQLAASAVQFGADVVVAAPAAEASGSGASITAVEQHGHIVPERRAVDGLDGVPVYAVQATPALIALISMHGAFGEPPDLVISGVNRGANVGRAIVHSGTVGAALTAGINGALGLAVSLDVGLVPRGRTHWHTASELAMGLLPFLFDQAHGTVLNVNTPDVEPEKLVGLVAAPLAPFGIVQTVLTEEGEGIIRLGIADSSAPPAPGTDAAYLADGFAVVTALTSVCESAEPSLEAVTSHWGGRTPDAATIPSART